MDSTQALAQLKAAGFTLKAVSKLNPQMVEGYLALGSVRAASKVIGVVGVVAMQRPARFAGNVPSQSLPVEKVTAAHARGLTGKGIKVGILSVSFANVTSPVSYQDDINSGALPPNVTILEDLAGGGDDEGRAMTQLVYDIAPDAALGFATAFAGQVSFSNNMLALRDSFGADVLADDVYYYAEPIYSDGLLAQTVDAVIIKSSSRA